MYKKRKVDNILKQKVCIGISLTFVDLGPHFQVEYTLQR